jgi:RNA polymerase-binding transcription factor DksA
MKAAKPVITEADYKKSKAKTSKGVPVEAPVVKQAPAAPVTGGKQVIVPSKPAINPRPVKGETAKAEAPKSNKPVAIPKTSTDKVVDYAPDFTKSVLDTPVQPPNNPTMRYSDAELQEFRDLINKKLDAAKKELAYLQGLITRKDEMGGDETDNRYMTMEDGSMSMEREQLSQMASRQITFIDHLEKAVMRIESKTYGVCRVTGKLIDKARLRAVPHATLSMEAKLGIVK